MTDASKRYDPPVSLTRGASFPLGPFTPYVGNPILRPLGDSWESANLYNPAAIVVGEEVVLLYRAHAEDVISHIGIARSRDGVSFEREAQPLLSPEHPYESHGCEDPRIVEIEGTYYLTYTGFTGSNAQLCLATSLNLRSWTKHGPIVPTIDTWAEVGWMRDLGRESKPWSKAGVIYPERINGLYYMYFGEGSIYYATSPDLFAWTPYDEPIYRPTPGEWDESLVEIGATPVLTDNGLIVLLINGARVESFADKKVNYQCGQIAIPLNDPTHVIAKMTTSWLHPQSFEDTHGLVSNVTFVEGLVHFDGRWLAYYGQSDTTLAVAIFDPATDSYV